MQTEHLTKFNTHLWLKKKTKTSFSKVVSVQFSSVSQLCPTLCDPVNHSTPGLPVHHQLPESTQTHVHWVIDTIQSSHSILKTAPWVSVQFISVQFSPSVMSDSFWPHESQHIRPPCPSPTPGVHSNSHSSSRWCHPAISSSVVPFSSCPQSLPASGYFPLSQLFTCGGQNTGVSPSALVLPMNTQDWSPLGWTGWTPKSLLQHHSLKASILQHSAFFTVQLSYIHNHSLIHNHWKSHSLD